MPEKQASKKLEFSDGKVSKWTCLITFLPHYTDAKVRRLYHIDVVSSISDRKSCLVLRITLHKPNQGRFLLWWGTIDYESMSLQ